MRFAKILAVLAAALYQPCEARFRFGERICVTQYSTKSTARVPTQYLGTTVTFTITARVTTTPTITITPTRVVRKTITTTATTTLPQLTDTITVTTTNTATDTIVTTDVSTVAETTSTTITTTPTLTASVSSAFLPFASNPAVIAAGGGTPGSSKRSDDLHYARRGLDLVKRDADLAKFNIRKAPRRYPSKVTCYIFVLRIVRTTTTITAHKTKTRIARPVTSTSTRTLGTTITVSLPHASSTVTATSFTTITTTSTVSSTTTTTTTETSTVAAPTATYYPQCQGNNLIQYVGGNHLYYLAPGSGTNTQAASTPDAVTCCELCANTANCAGFSGPLAPFTDCYLFITGTCDASATAWTVYNANGQTEDFSVVGNGNCGQGNYGGNL